MIRDLSSAPLRWHRPALDAAQQLGLTQEAVESIVRRPTHVTIDPSSGYRDWPTERRRHGDVTIVVTYPSHEPPKIWGVYVHLPLDPTHRSSAGGGNVVARPKTMRELRKRIAENPYLRIKPGGHHDKVVDVNDRVLTTLPSTPSDHHSVANAVSVIARKGYDL